MLSTFDGRLGNVSQLINAAIYAANNLQPIATILRHRRLTFAGHCYRSYKSASQPVMDVLFLGLKGPRTRGSRINYQKLLCEELLLDNVQNAMLGRRDYWRKITRSLF